MDLHGVPGLIACRRAGREGAATTVTPDAVPKKEKEPLLAQLVAAAELVRQPREQGLSLSGLDGSSKQLASWQIQCAR